MSVNGTHAPLSSENRPSVMGREYRAFIDSDAKSGTTACGCEFVRVGGMRAAPPSSCVPTARNPVTDKAVLVNRQFVFSSDWGRRWECPLLAGNRQHQGIAFSTLSPVRASLGAWLAPLSPDTDLLRT